MSDQALLVIGQALKQLGEAIEAAAMSGSPKADGSVLVTAKHWAEIGLESEASAKRLIGQFRDEGGRILRVGRRLAVDRSAFLSWLAGRERAPQPRKVLVSDAELTRSIGVRAEPGLRGGRRST